MIKFFVYTNLNDLERVLAPGDVVITQRLDGTWLIVDENILARPGRHHGNIPKNWFVA